MFRDLIIAATGMLWAALLVLVGGRFLALLAGADQSSELIDALYHRSDFWVKPFSHVLGLTSRAVGDTGTFEPASLVALASYFIAGAVVITLLRTSFFGAYRQHYA